MDINPKAPVLTRDEILINAPLKLVWRLQTNISEWPRWLTLVPRARFEGNLQVGSVFYWEEGGMQIESTVQEIVPQRRLVWSGTSQGINAVHVWEFTQTDRGVLVHSEESWDGAPALAQAAALQPLLDAATRTWLANLKGIAEQT